MNNKSYIVLANSNQDGGLETITHPYTKRSDAENNAYEIAHRQPYNTFYVAELQTKYKATEVVVTELT